MNRVGDVGLLAAMMLMVSSFGTVTFDGVAAGAVNKAGSGTLLAIGVLLLVGACGKVRPVPASGLAWRRDGRPDSGLRPHPRGHDGHRRRLPHMVRSGFVYAASAFGAAGRRRHRHGHTGVRAIVGAAKDDMKKVLAASTMSQIGYMMLAAALGPPAGAAFAVFHLVTHGFFKANMFSARGPSCTRWTTRWTCADSAACTSACAGHVGHVPGRIPPLSASLPLGYFSKDKIIEAAFVGEGWRPWVFGGSTMAVAGLTAFTCRGCSSWYSTARRGSPAKARRPSIRMRPSATMCVPQIVLAVGSIGLGFVLNRSGLRRGSSRSSAAPPTGSLFSRSGHQFSARSPSSRPAPSRRKMYAASPVPTRPGGQRPRARGACGSVPGRVHRECSHETRHGFDVGRRRNGRARRRRRGRGRGERDVGRRPLEHAPVERLRPHGLVHDFRRRNRARRGLLAARL